jgi:cytochrome c biogenesis protein CcdA
VAGVSGRAARASLILTVPEARPARRPGRASIVAVLAMALAWAAAVAAAILLPGDAIAGGIERAAGGSAERLGQLADLLRVGYSFSVGMVAAVNPCGFALLPAYLALFLGSNDGPTLPVGRQLARACWIGALVTLGFVALFGAAGLALTLASVAVGGALARVGVVIGTILVGVGGLLLGGGVVPGGRGGALAGRIGRAAGRSSALAYFAYGVAYGLASLGCALPLFLGVVGSALTIDGVLPALRQYLLYALGMGTVITVLTLLTALARQGVIRALRRAAPVIAPLGALLLILAGTYVIHYWLTAGGLLGR